MNLKCDFFVLLTVHSEITEKAPLPTLLYKGHSHHLPPVTRNCLR